LWIDRPKVRVSVAAIASAWELTDVHPDTTTHMSLVLTLTLSLDLLSMMTLITDETARLSSPTCLS
jgi:hypothetical protein